MTKLILECQDGIELLSERTLVVALDDTQDMKNLKTHPIDYLDSVAVLLWFVTIID